MGWLSKLFGGGDEEEKQPEAPVEAPVEPEAPVEAPVEPKTEA